jgi:hypothetical protein
MRKPHPLMRESTKSSSASSLYGFKAIPSSHIVTFDPLVSVAPDALAIPSDSIPSNLHGATTCIYDGVNRVICSFCAHSSSSAPSSASSSLCFVANSRLHSSNLCHDLPSQIVVFDLLESAALDAFTIPSVDSIPSDSHWATTRTYEGVNRVKVKGVAYVCILFICLWVTHNRTNFSVMFDHHL